eukprot:gene31906-41397_t
MLAGVACVSSLLLLKLSLESWQEGSFYQIIGLGGISYGQITTSIFLKVAVSDFLSLFSARAGEKCIQLIPVQRHGYGSQPLGHFEQQQQYPEQIKQHR